MIIEELMFKIIWVLGGIVFVIIGTLIVLTPTFQDEKTATMLQEHIKKVLDCFVK